MSKGLSIAFANPGHSWKCCMCSRGDQNCKGYKLIFNGVDRMACPPCVRDLVNFVYILNGNLVPPMDVPQS